VRDIEQGAMEGRGMAIPLGEQWGTAGPTLEHRPVRRNTVTKSDLTKGATCTSRGGDFHYDCDPESGAGDDRWAFTQRTLLMRLAALVVGE